VRRIAFIDRGGRKLEFFLKFLQLQRDIPSGDGSTGEAGYGFDLAAMAVMTTCQKCHWIYAASESSTNEQHY